MKKLLYLTIRLCVIASLLVPAASSIGQDQEEELEISLLTASDGEALYATFGHSALRVVDKKNGKDLVFDFGVFDFDAPFFAWKFMRGDLDYQLAVRSFDHLISAYQFEQRGVIEERLNLSPAAKRRLYGLLIENYKPANRYYRYDFLYDNCSTRIRDLLFKLDIIKPGNENTPNQVSFRNYLYKHLTGKEWLKFGIDILLGARADKIMTFEEQMFLPDNLSLNLRSCKVKTENGPERLLLPAVELLEEKPKNARSIILGPAMAFSLLLLALLTLAVRRPVLFKKLGIPVYFLMGLAGFFLTFMWAGTGHYTTKWNWNLLWVNPVYLLIPFLKRGTWKGYLMKSLGILNLLIFIFWSFLPQQLNLSVIPLIGIMIIFNYARVDSPIGTERR